MEVWKDIKDYEGLYQVSNFGNVRSLLHFNVNKGYYSRIKEIRQYFNKRGYKIVWLYKYGKRKGCLVHRLVAEAFIDNPNNYPQVNHKNEFEKDNNCVENLEWCTNSYNYHYGTRIKRVGDKNKKKVICVELNKEFESIKKASEEFNINANSISMVCNKHRKKAGGYIWRYKDI